MCGSIELQVQEQPAEVRSAVYSHLEAFVPCNKEALLKRLKKLSLNIQVCGSDGILRLKDNKKCCCFKSESRKQLPAVCLSDITFRRILHVLKKQSSAEFNTLCNAGDSLLS